MKKNWIALAAIGLLIFCCGTVSAMDIRVEATPEWAPGKIMPNTPFTIDIYYNNNDTVEADPANGYRLSYSTPFAFYSPDGSITNITHIDVDGEGPTDNIEILNGFDGYWGMFFGVFPWSYDGALPDSLNFTGISNSGWPNNLGEQLYIRFNFESAQEGTFCIDSIGGQTGTFDWLLDDPSPNFGGPYCWDITDDTVEVFPVQLSVENIVANTCSFECVPVIATDFENVAGVELHLTYDDDCMDFDSIDLGPLEGATINGGGGEVHIIWDDYANPLTLEDGSTLVQLCFSNIVGQDCPIVFSETTELVDDTGTPLELILDDGSLGYLCPSTPAITCPSGELDFALCDGMGEINIEMLIADYESVVTSMGSWSDGTLTFSSAGPAQYNIMIYAYNCCGAVADTCEVVVNVTEIPVVELTCPAEDLNHFLCGPEMIYTDVAVQNYDSVWTSGGTWDQGAFYFMADTAGTYSFWVFAKNVCGTDSCQVIAHITMNSAPMVTAQDDLSVTMCAPEEVCLSYSVSDIDAGQEFAEMLVAAPAGAIIDTTNNTVCYTAEQEGSYEFIIGATDECGAADEDTVTLTVTFDYAPMIVCLETVDISICEAGSVCVVMPIDNADSVWTTAGEWADGRLCFEASTTETYYFTVYAENNCGIDSCDLAVNITLGGSPTISCPPELTELFLCEAGEYCFDMAITGATSVEAMNGSWQDDSFCFDADTAGLYSLMVIARNDCDSVVCEFSYLVTLGQAPEITCPQIEFNAVLCGSEMVCFDLEIVGADSVYTPLGNWQNGLICFTPETAGTYYSYVAAFNDCGWDSCNLVYTIDFVPEPEVICPVGPIDIELSGPQVFCVFVDIFNYDSVNIVGSMGNPYWIDSALCFDVTQEGTYSYEIWAFNECYYDSCYVEVNVTFPTPTEACFTPTSVTGPAPLEVCFENCSVFDIDTSLFLWYVDDSIVSYEFEPCLSFTEPGCYDVALIVDNGYNADTAYVEDAVCVEEVYPPQWISVYCATPILNDVPLMAGDVIEAFDPDRVLCGIDTVDGDGSYGLLDIVHDDITTFDDEGAMEGDTISFAINGVDVGTDPVIIWTQDGDYFELCTFTTAECLTLTLKPGWNWISWNLAYSDDIGDFVSDFSDCIYVVHGFDQRGLTYVPALADFSTLNSVDYYHGYMFKMDCSASVEVCGPEINSGEGIVINYGWNLVSYWPNEELELETALSSIINDILVVLGFSNGGGLVWAPGFVDYNTLTHMDQRFGYWIKSSTSTWLYYPGFTGPVVPVKSGYTAEKVTPSRSWMSLYGAGITLDGQNLADGSTIDVYTGDKVLCGSSTISGGLLKFMPVYGYDNAENITLAYPQPGDELMVYINGVRAYPDVVWDNHGAIYRLDHLSTSEDGSTLMPEGFALYQNYPNPFNPTTSIRFHLPEAGNVELAVFNTLGQKIRTIINESLSAGEHISSWNGRDEEGNVVASGIYLYRLKSGNLVQTKKMNLMK